MTRSELSCAIGFFHKLARDGGNTYYVQRAMEIAQYWSTKEVLNG